MLVVTSITLIFQTHQQQNHPIWFINSLPIKPFSLQLHIVTYLRTYETYFPIYQVVVNSFSES